MKLWEVATGKELHHFIGNVAKFSPDGKYLVSGSGSETETNAMKLWDVDTGKEIRTFSGKDKDYIHSITFSPDGKYIVSGGNRGVILWEVATGRAITRWKIPDDRFANVKGLDKEVDTTEIAMSTITFSPDSRYAILTYVDEVGFLLEIQTEQLIRIFEASNLAFTPDSRGILGISETLKRWDIETGKEKPILTMNPDEKIWSFSPVESVAFSPNGQYALSGHANSDIGTCPSALRNSKFEGMYLWEVLSGKLIRSFGPKKSVYSVVFSPDGKNILSTSDNTMELWDVETGKEIRTFAGYGSVAFSPDGKYTCSSYMI